MSDTSPFGFGRFVPGFDFLQNLAKGSAAGMPSMSHWVAPTVSVEELEKRIEELKAVQFWLEQNSRALAATIQALEVQKMTLATLKGMNVAMGDLAGAFAGKGAEAFAPPPAAAPTDPRPAQPAQGHGDGTDEDADRIPPEDVDADAEGRATPGVVDPLQWWTALGTQFQQIAASALKDATAHPSALDATRDMAAQALKTATGMASQFAAQGAQGMQDMQDATRRAAQAAGAAGSKPAAAPSKKKPARKAPNQGTASRRTAAAAPAAPRARKAGTPPPAPAAAARKAPARRSRPAGG